MRDVKFGKWCRENGEDWWTGTKEELLMAKKAGHVTDNDRVVVVERKRELGEVVMSVLKWLPGFLPCDGRKFDKEIFSDLYEALGDDHTPDLREAAPVGAGEREADVEHDVFEAGEFKDDQTQTHVHTRGTMEITGQQRWIWDRSTAIGAFYNGNRYYCYHCEIDSGDVPHANYPADVFFKASRTWTGETSYPQGKSASYDLITGPSGNPSSQGWYELKVNLQQTEDTSAQYGKQYYDNSGHAVYDIFEDVNPDELKWYELNTDEPDEPDETENFEKYVLTKDTSVNIDKDYYRNQNEDSLIDLYSEVKPKEKNWQEAVSEEYVKTKDTSVSDEKQYFKENMSDSAARIGNVTRGKRFGMNFFIAY